MKTRQWSTTMSTVCLVSGLVMIPQSPALAVSFTPPSDNASPTQGSGGASRGSFQFVPPSDNAAPRAGAGGASRQSDFFIPLPDNAMTTQSAGESRDVEFIPTPNQTVPESATGEASRTNDYGLTHDLLTGSAVSMLAITPPNFYGLTVSERPTFMAYLPASSAHQAIFRIKDETQAVVYEQAIPLDGETGIVTVQLPESGPALEIDQYYQWFIILQTEEELTPASPFVDAWIKRVEPSDAIAQIQEANDVITLAETLAQAGIWYDTSAMLATLQREQSSLEHLNHWSELLTSVGLGDLTEAPLLSTRPNPSSTNSH